MEYRNVAREHIRERDGNRCARCGSSRDLHVHHRITRSQGGRNFAENLITLCAECHHWAHMHPHAARDEGLLLKGSDNPGTFPLRHFAWPDGKVLLGHELDFIIWTEELEAEIEARGEAALSRPLDW